MRRVGLGKIRAVAALGLLFTMLLAGIPYLPIAQATTNTPNTGLIVPLYVYPNDTGTGYGYAWPKLISAHNAYPNVPIYAIANPDNGPGSGPTTPYEEAIENLSSYSGITVLGYVPTDWCQGLAQLVNEDYIETWESYYQSYGVKGLFFDQMAYPGDGNSWTSCNTGGMTPQVYYALLDTDAKDAAFSFTYGNPGADVNYTEWASSTVYGSVDSFMKTVNIYEGSTAFATNNASIIGGSESSNCGAVGWHLCLPKSDFSLIEHSLSALPPTENQTGASTLVGFVFYTHSSDYSSLPTVSWLKTELSNLDTDSVAITVKTTYDGSPITGYNVDFWQKSSCSTSHNANGCLILYGFTQLTLNATSGWHYTLEPQNYDGCDFSQWSTGSTSQTLSVSETSNTTLTAEYTGSCT